MTEVFIRRERESEACGIVIKEDLRLVTQVENWSVYLTQQGTWVVKLPPQMMAGIPYVIPSNETLLKLLLSSPHRETDEVIKKKIEELTY